MSAGKLISADIRFHKLAFPVFMFGVLVFVNVSDWRSGWISWKTGSWGFALFQLLALGLMLLVYFSLIYDMADEVLESDTELVFRFRSTELRVPFSGIERAQPIWGCGRIPRVVVTLRSPCSRGYRLAFSPDRANGSATQVAEAISLRAHEAHI